MTVAVADTAGSACDTAVMVAKGGSGRTDGTVYRPDGEIVPAVVEVMGDAFPELRRDPKHVIGLIREEEESFIRTLDRGIGLFQEAADRAKAGGTKTISGIAAFQLHDTYGVYIDITEQMAGEAGLKVDRAGYSWLMEEAKRKAREAQKKHIVTAVTGELPGTDDAPKYVSAAFIRWQHTVRNQKGRGPGMVSNNTQ